MEHVGNAYIVKPTIFVLIKMVNARLSSWESDMEQSGGLSKQVDSQSVSYKWGDATNIKDEFETIIKYNDIDAVAIGWAHLYTDTTILDDLQSDLKEYYNRRGDGGALIYNFQYKDINYQFNLVREQKVEIFVVKILK